MVSVSIANFPKDEKYTLAGFLHISTVLIILRDKFGFEYWFVLCDMSGITVIMTGHNVGIKERTVVTSVSAIFGIISNALA